MKRILLTLSLLCLCIVSHAQKIRFSDTTNKWWMKQSICSVFSMGNTQYDSSITYYYSGQTSINGKMYSNIHKSATSGVTGYVFDDTVANKVFFRYYNTITSLPDTIEQLLYNYNWQLNDTVKYSTSNSRSICWVTNVDSVQISGLWHKKWEFHGMDSGLNIPAPNWGNQIVYNVVEGIGCLNGFDYPFAPITISSSLCSMTGSTSDEVRCFANHSTHPVLANGIITYGINSNNIFDNAMNCSSTGIAPVYTRTPTVSPNPITYYSKIVFPHFIENGELIIYNMLGQKTAIVPFTGMNEITIGNYITQAGMYYYQLRDHASSTHYSGKFIAE
ncbi:MAG: T9SS type A sorting domain-containing protein [Bacteroidota bacterium]